MRYSAPTPRASESRATRVAWQPLAFVACLGLIAGACTQNPSSEAAPSDLAKSNPLAAQNAVMTPETTMSSSKDIATLPPLDRQVPAHLETATFALG